MSSNPEAQVDPKVLEQKRQQILRLVEEISKLSESQIPPQDYWAEYLQRVLTALAAPAGAIWGRTPQGHLQIQYQINFREVGLDQVENGMQCHAELLRQVAQLGRPRLFPPQSGTVQNENGQGPGPANLTRFWVHIAPIMIEKQVAGLIEIWQDPERSPNAQRGFLQFLSEISEHAATYLKNTQFRQVMGQQQIWVQLEAFSRQVHNSLTPKEVAYQVVNEGRRLIQTDRVCVATRLGSATKVEAISGADVIEKRSSLVQTMRTLFDEVLVWGERLLYTGTKDDSLPPKVLDALDAYLAESNSKILIVQPLKDEREAESKRPCRSAIMVEAFEPNVTAEQLIARMEIVAKHAAPALYNSLEHKRLPFQWALRPIASVQDSMRGKPLAIAGAVAAGLAALVVILTFVPWRLRMDAKGKLYPKDRQYVYSRLEGPITAIRVKNLSNVHKDQELLTIQDLNLEMQIGKLKADMDAAERARVLYQMKLKDAKTEEERTNYNAQIIAQRAAYDKAKAEYDVRLVYSRDPKRSAVPAPITGTVVTFDPIEKLEGKLVKQGEYLLQVARLDGPWEIVLAIPEKHVGHVREALAKSPTGYLEVDLLLTSHPDHTYKGKLHADGLSGEAVLDDVEPDTKGTVLKARVEIEDIPPEMLTGDLLVSSEVRAKIRCGNRAMGYTLLYELWEFFYEKVLF